MKYCFTALPFVILFALSTVQAFRNSYRIKELYNDGVFEYMAQLRRPDPNFINKNVSPTMEQPIDHDNPSLGNFSQRYIFNDYYYRPGGPVILYISGENELIEYAIEGQVATLANATGGLLVALEHRYFGRSLPFDTFTTENMRYLTVDQALRDTAAFIRTFRGTPRMSVDRGDRWIVTGGSYAGNLAAWMRIKYPDIVFAAYASSAPVNAKLDFFEYDQAVFDGLPLECSTAMAASVSHIDSILTGNDDSAKSRLKAQFGLREVKDDTAFAGALTDLPSLLVQYGNPRLYGTRWMSFLCDSLTINGPSPAEITFAWGRVQQTWMQAAYTNVTKEFIDTTVDTSPSASRGWYWLICNEFGYWQTAPTPPAVRLRSKLITLKSDMDSCKDVFPGGPSAGQVVALNALYAGPNTFTDRLLYVNGELDPWRRLSVSAPDALVPRSTPLRPIYVVPGGSHCKDFSFPQPSDTPELLAIREKIVADISRWIQQDEALKLSSK